MRDVKTVQELVEERGLNFDAVGPRERNAIRYLVDLRTECAKRTEFALSRLESKPMWGISYSALMRAADLAESCVLTFPICPAVAEITSRSVVEASVNYIYIMSGDRLARFVSFIAGHIAQERRQNATWETAVKNAVQKQKMGARDAEVHRLRIQAKDEALKMFEDTLMPSFRHHGADTQNPEPWPNAFQRFQACGKEVTYRTVFAGLSSQTHHDAEDLINELVGGMYAQSGDQTLDVWSDLEREQERFAWYAVCCGLREFHEAMIIYLAAYDLVTSADDPYVRAAGGQLRSLMENALQAMPHPDIAPPT